MYISDIGSIFIWNYLSSERYQITKQNSMKIEKYFNELYRTYIPRKPQTFEKISQILLTVREKKSRRRLPRLHILQNYCFREEALSFSVLYYFFWKIWRQFFWILLPLNIKWNCGTFQNLWPSQNTNFKTENQWSRIISNIRILFDASFCRDIWELCWW